MSRLNKGSKISVKQQIPGTEAGFFDESTFSQDSPQADWRWAAGASDCEIGEFDVSNLELDFEPWPDDALYTDLPEQGQVSRSTTREPVRSEPQQKSSASGRRLLPRNGGDFDELGINPGIVVQNPSPRRLKRMAQNRAAQQAFRARKEKQEKELREKVVVLEARCASLTLENENLKDEISALKTCLPTSQPDIRGYGISDSDESHSQVVVAGGFSPAHEKLSFDTKPISNCIDSAIGSERSVSPAASTSNDLANPLRSVSLQCASSSPSNTKNRYIVLTHAFSSGDDDAEVLLLIPGSSGAGSREVIRLSRQIVDVVDLQPSKDQQNVDHMLQNA